MASMSSQPFEFMIAETLQSGTVPKYSINIFSFYPDVPKKAEMSKFTQFHIKKSETVGFDSGKNGKIIYTIDTFYNTWALEIISPTKVNHEIFQQ